MTLNELLDTLWKMVRTHGVDGDTQVVIENVSDDGRGLEYMPVTHVQHNEVYKQIRIVHDEGISPEAWAEALREKKNNPL